MKKFILISLCIFGAFKSHAVDKNYYVKGEAGISIAGNKMKTSSGYFENKRLRISPQFTLGTGYNATEQLRFDCTYSFIPHFKYRGSISATGQQVNEKQKIKTHVIMFNGYYHFLDRVTPDPTFSPFIGAGAGVALVKPNSAVITSSRTSAVLFNTMQSSTNPALGGTAGVSMKFIDNLALELSYKYLYMGKTKGFNQVMTQTGLVNASTKKNKLTAHNVSLGARYNF